MKIATNLLGGILRQPTFTETMMRGVPANSKVGIMIFGIGAIAVTANTAIKCGTKIIANHQAGKMMKHALPMSENDIKACVEEGFRNAEMEDCCVNVN